MKKSLVAVGVIVALGVVWTGASWYTGKQLESRIAGMIANANSELKRSAPQAGVELGYQNYQRGVFSSHLQLVVKPIEGVANPLIKPGQSVVFNEDVSHGPFPLAQLKKLNVIPSMASVRTTLVNNEASKPLFDMTKGQSVFDSQTRVGYNGSTASEITLAALNYEKAEEKVAFSGGTFNLDADGEGNEISLKGDAQSGLVSAVNEYGQRVQMTFNGLKSDGSSKLTEFDERVGAQKLSIEKFAVAVEGKEMAVIDGLHLDAKSDVGQDKKKIDSEINYVMDALKVQNQNLGSGKLTVKIGGIDGQAWHQFSQQYNGQIQGLLTDPAVQDNPALYQQKALEILVANFPLLLKGDPVVTVAPLSWKNDKGESSFNLSLFLKDPSANTTPATTPEQQLDRVVKSLESKLVIPMDMATEFMTQIARLEGYQEDQAEKLASQQVKGLAAMGQMFR
ncbi:YdgA family protein, partial [Atlantibacter subterraneus]|uniref:YdgA family protein n=1 Tax=Atlantibacter subterraneus TaxID=255519 RepID=UPI002FDD880F